VLFLEGIDFAELVEDFFDSIDSDVKDIIFSKMENIKDNETNESDIYKF
jgi:hypothetical protein